MRELIAAVSRHARVVRAKKGARYLYNDFSFSHQRKPRERNLSSPSKPHFRRRRSRRIPRVVKTLSSSGPRKLRSRKVKHGGRRQDPGGRSPPVLTGKCLCEIRTRQHVARRLSSHLGCLLSHIDGCLWLRFHRSGMQDVR